MMLRCLIATVGNVPGATCGFHAIWPPVPREMARPPKPTLLWRDELGYVPIDKYGADGLFQVISQRYEHGSILITTNKVFKH